MELRSIDLNLLVILDALLQEKNVTHAGKRVFLTQSATSGALAKLRDIFGDQLLVAVGHNKLALTPFAESLLDPFREIILSAEMLLKHDIDFNPQESTRKFKMKMSDYMFLVLMTHAIPSIARLGPSVGIDIDGLEREGSQEQDLENGDIDFLLMPRPFLSQRHPFKELFRDTYVCCVWSGNRRVGKTLSLDDYFSMPHISSNHDNNLYSPEDWIRHQTGTARRVDIVLRMYSLIPSCLVGTERIATVHHRMAKVFAKTFDIRILKPPIPSPVLTEALQWNSYRSHDPGIQWMKECLLRAAQQLPPIAAP
jgi:DNA-binding transcriptional LysR family regulator